DVALLETHAVLEAELPSAPSRLIKVHHVDVDGGHERTALRDLERVEPRVATDVESRPAREISGQTIGDLQPFPAGKVPERVIRLGLGAIGQMKVVEPVPQTLDLLSPTGRLAELSGCVFGSAVFGSDVNTFIHNAFPC